MYTPFEKDLIVLNEENDRTWKSVCRKAKKIDKKRINHTEIARIFFMIEDIEYRELRKKHNQPIGGWVTHEND